MLPDITLKVSMRLPPTFPHDKAEGFLRELLTKDTPFGASVSVEQFEMGEGWNSATYEPWFEEAIQQSAQTVFGSKAYSIAQGGAIPVVGSLAKAFPMANIVVSGALGPNANAHGPN